MNYSWYVLRTSKNPSSPNYLSVNLDLVWGSIPCRDLTDLTIKNGTENMSWFALSSLQRSGGKAGKVRVRSCGCHHQDIQWDICTKDLGVNPTKKKVEPPYWGSAAGTLSRTCRRCPAFRGTFHAGDFTENFSMRRPKVGALKKEHMSSRATNRNEYHLVI